MILRMNFQNYAKNLIHYLIQRMAKNRAKRTRESSDGISFMTESEQETLYTAVLSSKAPMQDLATGWIERYQVKY